MVEAPLIKAEIPEDIQGTLEVHEEKDLKKSDLGGYKSILKFMHSFS